MSSMVLGTLLSIQMHKHLANSKIKASQGLKGKESACQTADVGLIPGLGRSSGEGNDSPLQYSYLENPMDRGAGGLQSIESHRVEHD